MVPCVLFAEDKESESPWTIDANASAYSSYMFRGITLYDGISYQPSVNINYDSEDYGVFHLNLWSHMPSEGSQSTGRFSEFDATLTYDYSFEDFTLSVGHTWITYYDDLYVSYPETSEIFASISLDKLFLTPVFTVYHDYRAYDSQYYEMLFSHTIESQSIGEWFNLTPFVDLGFGSNSDVYFYKSGYLQTTIGISSDIKVGPVTITPSINYSMPHEDVDNKRTWGGISIIYSF